MTSEPKGIFRNLCPECGGGLTISNVYREFSSSFWATFKKITQKCPKCGYEYTDVKEVM
jgi:ribosomal protein S27AE